ncbi:MAG: hypothetical protein U0136_05275 [Bdellovibrionota bacterium]
MGVMPTVAAGALMFVLMTILLFPAGTILLYRSLPMLPSDLRPLVNAAASLFLLAAVLAVGCALGIAPSILSWLFRAVMILGLAACIHCGAWRLLCDRTFALGMLLFAIYFLLSLVLSAYPYGRIQDVRPERIQSLSQLAVDNLIPFDVARYFTERIPPSAVDVVPDWRFTDRGPLGGMIAATVLLTLGITESTHWFGATDGTYFVVQSALIYLNLLALLAVWQLASHYFGRRSAACALLLVSSSYFFLVNSYFTWPKLLSAYLLLSGIAIFQTGTLPVLVGLLLAGSMLAHDAVVFTLVAFAATVLIRELRGRNRERHIYALIQVPASAACWYAPWMIYKWLAGSGSGRLLYNHVFCFKDPEVVQLGLSNAAERYFETNTLAQILAVRLDNLFYPLNVAHAWGSYIALWSKPYELALSVSHLAFYQFLYAAGIPTVLLLVLGLQLRRLLPTGVGLLAASCYGALLPAAMIFACALSTVNHAWAYPAFLFTALLAGGVAMLGGAREALLCGLAVSTNLLLAVFNLGFAKGSFAAQHAGSSYLLVVFILAVAFFALLLREVSAHEQ